MSGAAGGSWYFVSMDHYRTRGADAFRTGDGWYARCGRRVRGPLGSLDAAMRAADDMLAAQQAA